MKKVFLFIVILLPFSATSEPYEDARKAFSDCENAWFMKGKKDALERLKVAGTQVALRVNPLAKDSEERLKQLRDATDWLRKCGKIVYPD
ncbi:hypothetical protein ACRARG_04530 [Pseudooceanicola sp. C21-150M6]|uniref:hypothetical protein n=1 Tax=Pseudooceanicola sp. C21-150M6 TaxID=3434355 RepID=UPI003D7F9686